MNYRTIVHIQVFAALMTIMAIFLFVLRTTATTPSLIQAAIKTAPFYGLPLAVAIFMVMWERGSNPQKISGYKSESNKSLFSAFLQNTLEQTVLALLAIATLVAYAPTHFASLISIAGWIYIWGRFLFFVGYLISPMWRFYGFSLNFYTSTLLLIIGIGYMI